MSLCCSQLGLASFPAWTSLFLILNSVLDLIIQTSSKLTGLIELTVLKSIRPFIFPWTHCHMDRRSIIFLSKLYMGHKLSLEISYGKSSKGRLFAAPFVALIIIVEHILVFWPIFGNRRKANCLANHSLREFRWK